MTIKMVDATHSDTILPVASELFYRGLKQLYADFRSLAPNEDWPLARDVAFSGHREVVDESGHNFFMVALWSKKFPEAYQLYRLGSSCNLFNQQGRTVFHSMIAAINERFSASDVSRLLDIYEPQVQSNMQRLFPSSDEQTQWFFEWGKKLISSLHYHRHKEGTPEHNDMLNVLRFSFQGCDDEVFSKVEQQIMAGDYNDALTNPAWAAFKAEHTQMVLSKHTSNKGLAANNKRKI